MSIKAAYIVPHPPLIIPAVGDGKENSIRDTVDSYKAVAHEIYRLNPDTIVIVSPHSIMYEDYFHISPGKSASGDFRQFGVREVSYRADYDSELASCIERLAVLYDVHAGFLGEKSVRLDHGTMVPLHFINEAYNGDYKGKIVRIGLSGFSFEEHYKLGMLIQKASYNLNRSIVFIASGDLSHRLKEEGPYSYKAEGPEYDKLIMKYAEDADFLSILMMREDFCELAGECGQRSICMMAGALDGMDIKAEKLSYEGPFGVGYGVVSYSITGLNKERCFLERVIREKKKKVADRRKYESIYVALARHALETFILERREIKLKEGLYDRVIRGTADKEISETDNKQYDELTAKKAGCFVSLKINGRLRGCMGTTQATRRSLAEEIINNAISAATGDTRFDPVEAEELDFLEISVDVLGEIEDIASQDVLDVKRYGVIVSKGHKRGLLLPNLDGIDTIQQQISIAKQKAGIDENERVKLARFEVVRYY